MDPELSMQSAFRTMLIELSSKISPEELKGLIFLSKSYNIPTRIRDNMKSAVDLFEALEERNKLSVNDLDTLIQMLKTSCNNRTDVVNIVENFKRNFGLANNPIICQPTDFGGNQAPIQESGFLAEFTYLKSKLGREALHFLRRLGVDDDYLDQLQVNHPRDTKEVIHRALRHWETSNHLQPSKEKLIKALKAEHRNDLAQKIASSDFSEENIIT
ncbi:unnamed protein product [Lymnaea stagnalis]|uniref:Death domain-containing protein n=1 Tax=Lymnaea stagnalis TaxID=6523 RepID=A0AAV2HFC3_LYMST